MEPKKMGQFIKMLRKEKDLTQEQLAEELFVSSKTVSRWETGNTLPDLVMLQNIADYFGVDIREVIDGARFTGSEEAVRGTAEKEKVQKMAEYSEKKEKRHSRKIWLFFILVLAAAGAAAATLILKKRNEELDLPQSRYVTGEAVGYIPAGEDGVQICLLNEEFQVVRVLARPGTQMAETLRPFIDAQEKGLKLQAFCTFTSREEKNAEKKGEEYAYPAQAISLVGSLPTADPEWAPETARRPLVELRENYTAAEAERDGCVVMDGTNMVHGELRWLEFLARVREGKPSLIRVRQAYTRMDYLLIELMYDGSRYWISEYDKSAGEWTFRQDSYACLTEDRISFYEKSHKGYLLTDNPDETFSGDHQFL